MISEMKKWITVNPHRLTFGCPYCTSPLSYDLICSNCGFRGFFENSHFHLHRYGDDWKKWMTLLANIDIEIKKIEEYQKGQPKPPTVEPDPLRLDRAPEINNLMLNRIIHLAGGVRGKVFLDLGASSGWATYCFNMWGALSGVCLDINENLLFPTTPDERFIAIVGDGYHIPFVDQSFDFVFDCSSLHHFDNLEAVMTEIHRVIKPGGFYANQGNNPAKGPGKEELARVRTKEYSDKGMIDIQYTDDDYYKAYNKVFGGAELHPVEENHVWFARKK